MTIDASKLPAKALLDSSVLVSAFFGERAEDVSSREFYDAMVAHQRVVLISTVTITEILRAYPDFEIPRVRFVRAVVFDTRCARMCAKHFPPVLLKEEAQKAPPAGYWKLDALIAATAIAYGADCIVTRDDRQRRLASRAELPARTPDDFAAAQLTLPRT